jgi:xanthine dehydrogenase accessory factor
LKGFWQKVNVHLSQGEHVFVARVVEHTAHSPGTTGAGMIVAETGAIAGTIGGGIMEHNVVELARRGLDKRLFAPQVQTLYHRAGAGEDASGLICAGHQTNLYYLCRPNIDSKSIARAAHAEQSREAAELVITESGMTCSQTDASAEIVQSLLERRPEGWRYSEQLLNLRRAVILGGGHCGLALSRVLHHLGFDVTVFDTRSNLATLTQNTFADSTLVIPDYIEAGRLISYPTHTDVVVMTTDAPSDVRALLGVLDRPFRFVGAMGSAAKIKAIKSALAAEGVNDEALAGLTAPVGLPIGSNTPEEIAISVAAQLVRLRS